MKLAGDQGLVIRLFLLCYASLLRRDPLSPFGLERNKFASRIPEGDQGLVIRFFLLCYASLLRRGSLCRLRPLLRWEQVPGAS